MTIHQFLQSRREEFKEKFVVDKDFIADYLDGTNLYASDIIAFHDETTRLLLEKIRHKVVKIIHEEIQGEPHESKKKPCKMGFPPDECACETEEDKRNAIERITALLTGPQESIKA